MYRLLILLDRLENLKFDPALGKIRGAHLNHRFDLSPAMPKSEFLNLRLVSSDVVRSSLGQVGFQNLRAHLHRHDLVDCEYRHRLDLQWQSVL